MDLMLSSSYIQNIPNLSKDVRIFICKLSWNIALSKSGYLEKFRLFLLAAEILTDVSSSQVQQAVYVSALSAGISLEHKHTVNCVQGVFLLLECVQINIKVSEQQGTVRSSSNRDCKRNCKRLLIQRWQCSIHNGTLETFIRSKMWKIFSSF